MALAAAPSHVAAEPHCPCEQHEAAANTECEYSVGVWNASGVGRASRNGCMDVGRGNAEAHKDVEIVDLCTPTLFPPSLPPHLHFHEPYLLLQLGYIHLDVVGLSPGETGLELRASNGQAPCGRGVKPTALTFPDTAPPGP